MGNANLNISFKTILFTLFSLGVVYALYSVYPIIILMVLALIVALSIEPLVTRIENIKLNKKRIFSRATASLMSFFFVISLIVTAFFFIIPELAHQAPKLFETVQKTIISYAEDYNYKLEIPDLTQYTERALSISLSFVTNIVYLLTLILLSIYISIDWEGIKKFFHKLTPEGHRSVYDKILHEFEVSIGNWVKGQLGLMFFIGIVSTTILYFVGNPYYLPLGILAGLLEIVPIIGPFISTFLAVLISFALKDQTAGVITLASYYSVQLIENNLIVPKIMGKVSGFSPILIFLAFLIFTNFLGIIGAILAVPMLMFINILLKHLVLKK